MLGFQRSFVRMALFTVLAMMGGAAVAAGADPGLAIPASAEASDQRPGSLLIFNLVTSGSSPASQDTRISLTNSSQTFAAFVRLFFVDGSTGAPSDTTVCLTADQTVSLKASEVMPGKTGYLIAVAINGVTGEPAEFNSLSGQAQVRMASGHTGTIPAVGYSKLTATNVLSTDGTLAAVFFDGLTLAGSYSRAVRVLQVPDIPSPSDGNSTLVVVNRVGGNMTTSGASIGALYGVAYDDRENAYGFSTSVSRPQLVAEVGSSFPVTTPDFSLVVPSGRTGWMKLYSQSDIGYSGTVLSKGSVTTQKGGGKNAGTTTTTFSLGASNMRALTASGAANLVIPVRPPTCGGF